MISPDEFLAYLCKIEGGAVAVDLLKIGTTLRPAASSSSSKGSGGQNAASNGAAAKFSGTAKLRLALDMEDCLDRFYGGYYSDWACGGQWNRAFQFVQLLVAAFQKAQVELVAFFDGSLKENKRWAPEKAANRERILAVIKHIRTIGTPPPKVWWLPPSGLRTCLRNSMRTLNIPIVQTVNDHTMEIIAYFHEQKLDGILGLSPDYIIGNINRYFSSHDLRLSYKGSLECKELMVSRFLTNFSLTPDHLPFLAALFGGYTVLTEASLKGIYKKLNVNCSDDSETRIKRIAEIVRNSPTNDLAEFVKHLELQQWQDELRDSIEYYQRKGKFASGKIRFQFRKRVQIETAFGADGASGGGPRAGSSKGAAAAAVVADVVNLASETNENDEMARKILLDVNNLVDEADLQEETAAEVAEPEPVKTSNGKTKEGKAEKSKGGKSSSNFVYTLPSEILRTSLLRHQRGMMDARIFHLFNKKEIILPQVLEDEQYREVPSVHLFYRPARQQIYAILFNLYHQRYMYSKSVKGQAKAGGGSSSGKPEIMIKEWIWSPQNEYARPELVAAEQLPWSVSTIQRLWFGMAVEDKQRRMKAFLTVMRSDTPLMMNRGYVPQHMLVLACILRYIVTNPERSVLTPSELDAFLATAFSPFLNNVEYTQDMVLPGVNLRGVYLSTLLMQGFETASLANDACGVPLPWLTTNPWLVFDGKLFQMKLKLTGRVQSLHELCDNHIETVVKIERIKKAILEDADHFLLPDPFRQLGTGNNFNLGGGGGGLANFGGFSLPLLQPMAGESMLGDQVSYYGGNGGQMVGQRGSQSAAVANAMAAGFYNPSYGAGGQSNAKNMRGGMNNRSGANQSQDAALWAFMRGQSGLLGVAGGQKGHQLKVGGVVVGSWGSDYGRGGAPPQLSQRLMNGSHLSTRYNQVGRARNIANVDQMLQNRLNRLPMNAIPQIAQYPQPGYGAAANRTAYGGCFGGVGKPLKAGAKNRTKSKQANLKKQQQNKNKKAKGKKEKAATATDGAASSKKGDVTLLGEQLEKKLMIDGDDGESGDNNGSSLLLDSSELVAEICGGVLKEDDEDDEKVVIDTDATSTAESPAVAGAAHKGQPKRILTKPKAPIGRAGSQKEAVNGKEKGQGDNDTVTGDTATPV